MIHKGMKKIHRNIGIGVTVFIAILLVLPLLINVNSFQTKPKHRLPEVTLPERGVEHGYKRLVAELNRSCDAGRHKDIGGHRSMAYWTMAGAPWCSPAFSHDATRWSR
jgi:hypothetical protein